MGVDCSFYVKTIETHAHTFLTINILAIGRVGHLDPQPALSLNIIYTGSIRGQTLAKLWTLELPPWVHEGL